MNSDGIIKNYVLASSNTQRLQAFDEMKRQFRRTERWYWMSKYGRDACIAHGMMPQDIYIYCSDQLIGLHGITLRVVSARAVLEDLSRITAISREIFHDVVGTGGKCGEPCCFGVES